MFHDFFKVVVGIGFMDVVITEFFSLGKDPVLDLIQQVADLVSQVVPGGHADQAGLKAGTQQVRYGSSVIYLGGDVITEINGVSVSDYSDLFTALSNTRPGDVVPVTIDRNGTTLRLQVSLVERTEENLRWINR